MEARDYPHDPVSDGKPSAEVYYNLVYMKTVIA
jgi:hypothetical protein